MSEARVRNPLPLSGKKNPLTSTPLNADPVVEAPLVWPSITLAGEGSPPPRPHRPPLLRNENARGRFFLASVWTPRMAIAPATFRAASPRPTFRMVDPRNVRRSPQKTQRPAVRDPCGHRTVGRCRKRLTGPALGEAFAKLGCGLRLVEVAAGRLRECSHHLPHFLLRGGASLGERLLDERDKLVA